MTDEQRFLASGVRPLLLLTRRLPAAIEERAARDYRVRTNPQDQALSGPELAAAASDCGAAALIPCPADRLDAATLAALPASVRIISTFSVGTDHIDLAAARARGIVVTNTPDVLTAATAEIAILLLLGAARRASEGERMVRAAPGTPGAWTGWTPTQLLGWQLEGRRLAILGMGRIGQAVAHRARALGMEILYHNRTRLPPDQELGAHYHADPEAMLPLAQALSLHWPATPTTLGWLDARRLALLPRGAILVNTARGTVVDDAAVIAALASGQLAAAGLDVYAGEPNLHPGYRTLPNTFLLPHLGSATVETRNAMGFRILDNLDTFFAGGEPPDRVV